MFFEVISIYSLLVVLPLLGLVGIRLGKKDFLNTSAALSSVVLMIFFGLLLQKPLFLINPILLILSAFIYRGGLEREIKKETVNEKLKKIAMFLATISLFAAIVTTLYSERVLVINGCYTYQTPTSGGTICSDFRPDYVIPVILSIVGIAGIFRKNKIMLYASAAASFVRMVVYLSPVGILFVPSFVMLILSAFAYQKGIKKEKILKEATENHRQLLYFIAIIRLSFYLDNRSLSIRASEQC